MKKDIVLFGIQGSGKWTQASLLMEKLEWYMYFEPWQVFRALKSNNNVLGEHIRDRMDQGRMLDDAITFGIFDIFQHLVNSGKNMVVDGFLRSLDQMYYFLTQQYKYKRDFIWIHYDLSRDDAMKRILSRAEKEWRADDVERSIITRLDIYEKKTKPVIEYLDTIGKIIHIKANQTVEEIHKETISKLEKMI